MFDNEPATERAGAPTRGPREGPTPFQRRRAAPIGSPFGPGHMPGPFGLSATPTPNNQEVPAMTTLAPEVLAQLAADARAMSFRMAAVAAGAPVPRPRPQTPARQATEAFAAMLAGSSTVELRALTHSTPMPPRKPLTRLVIRLARRELAVRAVKATAFAPLTPVAVEPWTDSERSAATLLHDATEAASRVRGPFG